MPGTPAGSVCAPRAHWYAGAGPARRRRRRGRRRRGTSAPRASRAPRGASRGRRAGPPGETEAPPAPAPLAPAPARASVSPAALSRLRFFRRRRRGSRAPPAAPTPPERPPRRWRPPAPAAERAGAGQGAGAAPRGTCCPGSRSRPRPDPACRRSARRSPATPRARGAGRRTWSSSSWPGCCRCPAPSPAGWTRRPWCGSAWPTSACAASPRSGRRPGGCGPRPPPASVELTGSSVFDYIHPGDHSEVLEQLGLRTRTSGPPTSPSIASSSSSSSLADTPEIEAGPPAVPSARARERSFFVRMKSTLTKRGLHVKASGYKVIHVTGRLRARALGLVALGHALPPAPLAELPLHGHAVVFRLSLGLTILACESRVSEHMDLGPAELVGRSCYQFVHGQDAARIRRSHLDLLDKGQVVTGYYRWLQRAGGFVWLQSAASVALGGKSPGERHVLWVSYVLSQAEGGHTPLDAFQLPASAAAEDTAGPAPEPAEPASPVRGEQAAPPGEEAPQAQGRGIKAEPGRGDATEPEDSGDEEPAGRPAPPPREFTSVIRAGAPKQGLARPWGLVPPGDPPPALLHASFLPPVVRGLCTPSTIRYGPAELGLVYPHLQRLGPGPPFPEAFYPPLGLPYPGPAGTRGQRKGD
ncbi:neuronal PAS domain-containing protein 1 isoform X1 [Pipistrellus kuhlii]|uniref:neuronal PAS domain-containing protein 1 isoform X1 n=1 Tax=Pipistrellus kuhlii TaxID=59472 RepID=UPI001E270505|nr:neuronal PAS domain-containing protein 1 isoform X1 [Pipistrellus kuhlii]